MTGFGHQPRRLIIDTDIGVDDAIALVMALRYPGVAVELITTVAGNAPLVDTTRNALYVAELCGCPAPVHAGAAGPLLRDTITARHVHGEDGLGDYGFPVPARGASPGHAAAAIVDAANAAPGEFTLVTLGPLTNVALAVLQDPSFVTRLQGCVVMGGTIGNVTPAAEFNIYADAEAARIVFRSGLRFTLAGVELCYGEACSTREEYEHLAARADPVARFAGLMCRYLGEAATRRHGWNGEAAIPDAVAMAVALEPALAAEYIDCYVDVETRGELTYGETVIDRRGILNREANARVCQALDVAGYKALLRRTWV